MEIIKKIVVLIVFVSFSISNCLAQKPADTKASEALEELQNSIQNILTKTNTPGAGVLMLSGDNIVLLRGFGKADIENDIDVNEHTMFRLGSVSKLLVSLAVLKLQEEGLLNLKDIVSELIPDIKITNPWKKDYPIRVENLLEHSSGMDDWSLAELGSDDPKPKSLKEAINYYPQGRVARYVPGTRMEYSNRAVSIAAYIVEKASGMSYEDYIEKYFFKPLGMKHATFRNTDHYKKFGAKGYDNGVLMPYLHPLYRPSAAFTDSPIELVNLLRLFINRGRVDGVQIISNNSLNRMERNESMIIEKADFYKGIGLGNNSTIYKNFIYRGHGGSVPGTNTNFSYLPRYKLGFAVMVNNNDQYVVDILSRLIREFQIKDLPKKKFIHDKKRYKSDQDLTGYYIPLNYKFKWLEFFVKIKSLQKMWYKGDTLYVKTVLGKYPYKFHANGKNEFVRDGFNDFVIFQTKDPIEGQIIGGNMGMLKKISSVYAFFLIIIFWSFFLIPISIFLFAISRLFIYFFGNKKDKIALWICILTLLNIMFILSIILSIYIFVDTKIDAFLLLGNITPISVFVFVATIGFAVTSLWVPYYIFKNRRNQMSKVFYYHSALAAIFNLIFTIYFYSNGLIGIQTWA